MQQETSDNGYGQARIARMPDNGIGSCLHERLIPLQGQLKGKVFSQRPITPCAQTSSQNRQNNSQDASGRDEDSAPSTMKQEVVENGPR